MNDKVQALLEAIKNSPKENGTIALVNIQDELEALGYYESANQDK